MKKGIAVLLILTAAFSLFGWGGGHDDHAGLVLQYLPREVVSCWSDAAKKEFRTHWSHYPDSQKKIAPEIEALAQEYEGQAIIGKCDVDSNDALTGKFGVRNIPTVLFFKNGEVVDKQVGAAPKSVFEDKLKAIL